MEHCSRPLFTASRRLQYCTATSYCIVYRFLYSASYVVSQTEVLHTSPALSTVLSIITYIAMTTEKQSIHQPSFTMACYSLCLPLLLNLPAEVLWWPITSSDNSIGVSCIRLTLPDDANIYGNVHGGTILKLIEEAGAIIATRYCNNAGPVSLACFYGNSTFWNFAVFSYCWIRLWYLTVLFGLCSLCCHLRMDEADNLY